MKQLYDEDLVEAVVLLYVSGRRPVPSPLHVRRFHRAREKLYSILDPDERATGFFQLHLSWFREWGVEHFLNDVVRQTPLLSRELAVLAFRKARGKNEEGSELYVNADGHRHGVVALRPERFAQDGALRRFLNHELTHLSDMVDPSFHYSPDLYQPGQTVAEQRLMRERYRLFWDVTIDGRLVTAGRQTVASREQRRAEFDLAFSFLSEEKRLATFGRLWSGPAPRHSDLVSLASDPRELHSVAQPLGGTPCPLCGFATFEWADVGQLNRETLSTIHVQFPGWTEKTGVCQRCVELYESTSGLELPATICL